MQGNYWFFPCLFGFPPCFFILPAGIITAVFSPKSFDLSSRFNLDYFFTGLMALYGSFISYLLNQLELFAWEFVAFFFKLLLEMVYLNPFFFHGASESVCLDFLLFYFAYSRMFCFILIISSLGIMARID